MRGYLGWLGLGLLALTACQRDRDDDGVRAVTWISEGSGPANEAPLYRYTPGTRGIVKQQNTRSVRLEAGFIELPSGQRAIRSLDGKDGSWLVEREEGLFLIGGPRDGELEVPVLMVPSEVRSGMEWSVDVNADGDADYWFLVSDRQEAAPTILGPRTTWTISLVGEARQVVVERTYAEGLGIIGLEYTTSNGSPAIFTLTDVVIPADPADGAGLPDARPSLVLEPVEGTEGPLSFGRDGHHLSVLQPADDGESLVQVVGDGFKELGLHTFVRTTQATCIETVDAPLLGTVEGRVIDWVQDSAPNLQRLPPGCLLKVVSEGEGAIIEIASDAATAMIDDGEMVALPVTEEGGSTRRDSATTATPCCSGARGASSAWCGTTAGTRISASGGGRSECWTPTPTSRSWIGAVARSTGGVAGRAPAWGAGTGTSATIPSVCWPPSTASTSGCPCSRSATTGC